MLNTIISLFLKVLKYKNIQLKRSLIFLIQHFVMLKFKTIKTLYNVQKDNDKEERVVHETMDTDDLTFNDTNVDPYTQYKYKIVKYR